METRLVMINNQSVMVEGYVVINEGLVVIINIALKKVRESLRKNTI